jgi:hypothetical protein
MSDGQLDAARWPGKTHVVQTDDLFARLPPDDRQPDPLG